MAYLGGKPFSGLSQRQIDSLRQIFKQAPADCGDGLWRLVYEFVGPVESYSASALLSAARQALWREGQFYWPPDIPFVENLADRGRGHIGRQHHRAHGGTGTAERWRVPQCRRDRRALR